MGVLPFYFVCSRCLIRRPRLLCHSGRLCSRCFIHIENVSARHSLSRCFKAGGVCAVCLCDQGQPPGVMLVFAVRNALREGRLPHQHPAAVGCRQRLLTDRDLRLTLQAFFLRQPLARCAAAQPAYSGTEGLRMPSSGCFSNQMAAAPSAHPPVRLPAGYTSRLPGLSLAAHSGSAAAPAQPGQPAFG